MKKTILIVMLGLSITASAQNPIIQTHYTADPAPMVKGDTLFVYADVDEPKADFFWMYQWRVYSTTDMVNWTDHGELLGLNSFSWADDRAWATQCCERDGKYYWYICAHSKLSGGMAIGVAVSDSPTGPFKDAIGHPLYDDGKWDNIDPTVLMDGKNAYLVWGNPEIHQAKLADNMTSFDGEVSIIRQDEKSFGAPSPAFRKRGMKYKDIYIEGPWLAKRNKNYYLLYSAGGVPEHIAYSMSRKPQGPWIYKGIIMPQENETNSFTNHCGIIDFKGHSYFFYHTGNLPGGGGFDRSIAVEEFKYNKDGTIPAILPTREGVKPTGTLNPFQKTEASTIAWEKGLTTEQSLRTGVYVTDIQNGDWMKVREVNFSSQPQKISISAASASQGGTIELHADSINGKMIATINIPSTGGWENFCNFSANTLIPVTGVHDLFFVFHGQKGRKLMNFSWWEMEK